MLNGKFDKIHEQFNVELLKKRFGEQSLSKCDVMLKDYKDSEKMTKEYHKQV